MRASLRPLLSMGESKRPSRGSKRPPKMPGPPAVPSGLGGAAKRINLRDIREKGPQPVLTIRKSSDPSASELGDALVVAKRMEERAVLAESERDDAKKELSALQKKVARLEAELALIRASDGKSDPRKSNADLAKHVGAMVQGIAELRHALIQAAADLEALKEREQETAALRDQILSGAAALLVKAVGQTAAESAEPAPPRAPMESSPLMFAKASPALILPPESGNVRPPTSSVADIEVTIDITEVQELIESLLPPAKDS